MLDIQLKDFILEDIEYDTDKYKGCDTWNYGAYTISELNFRFKDKHNSEKYLCLYFSINPDTTDVFSTTEVVCYFYNRDLSNMTIDEFKTSFIDFIKKWHEENCGHDYIDINIKERITTHYY